MLGLSKRTPSPKAVSPKPTASPPASPSPVPKGPKYALNERVQILDSTLALQAAKVVEIIPSNNSYQYRILLESGSTFHSSLFGLGGQVKDVYDERDVLGTRLPSF